MESREDKRSVSNFSRKGDTSSQDWADWSILKTEITSPCESGEPANLGSPLKCKVSERYSSEAMSRSMWGAPNQ